MPETKRHKLVVTSVTLPLKEMARSLLLAPETLTQKMRDGRAAWPFSEIWGDRYVTMASGDYAGEARGSGIVALGKRNIRFQKPKRFGASRHGSVDDLVADLNDVRSVIVVDLRLFPEIRLCDIPSAHLRGAVKAGALGTNGWSGKAFDRWLTQKFTIDSRTMSHRDFRRRRGPDPDVQRGDTPGTPPDINDSSQSIAPPSR